MSYYDTIDDDVRRAKEILERGKPTAEGLEGINSPVIISLAGGTIYGGDIYAAYKILESFVAIIETITPGVCKVAMRAAELGRQHGAQPPDSIDK